MNDLKRKLKALPELLSQEMDKTTKLTDQFGSMKMSNMEGTEVFFFFSLMIDKCLDCLNRMISLLLLFAPHTRSSAPALHVCTCSLLLMLEREPSISNFSLT